MDPGFYYARWALGEALEAKGRTKEAIAEYEKASVLNQEDPLPMALLGRVYGRTGRREEALKILKRLKDASSVQRYVSPYNFALVYLGLGENDEAIRALEQTYEDRDGYNIAFLKIDAFLDPLRDDPRFQALVQKIFASAPNDR
jgi:tetratricopeptide (TPR) repeat protein